jgi:defect-in-organelle-trafficking protein DotB
VSQRLVPTVDGKRVALREYLVFDDKIRDILLDVEPINITAAVRKMVKEQGRTMEADAKEKFDAGLITERQYRVLAEMQKREDKDAEFG